MTLLSTAERLAELDRSRVSYRPERCLRAADRFADCQLCLDICPAGALQPGAAPVFDAQRCTQCLACLPACPGGAFSADDELNGLLNCLARAGEGPVELLCTRNPQIGRALAGAAARIQVRNCLAGLGAGALLCALALGPERIVLRVDHCPDCEWSALQTQVERQAQHAAQLAAARGYADRVQTAGVADLAEAGQQPVWDAHNPPLSRRDLFRMAAVSGRIALARTLAHAPEGGEHQPAHERRRLANALRRLPPAENAGDTSLAGLPFAALTVSSACSACGACARACPNGALDCAIDEAQAAFRLTIQAPLCNGCEVCRHVCAPEAIRVDHAPASATIFAADQPLLLQSGSLATCQRCAAQFAGPAEAGLCPVCAFRRRNPFGAALPPPLQAALRPGRQP